MTKFLSLLAAATTLISTIDSTSASAAASPKVVGYQFSKQKARDALPERALARRQKTVSAGLSNEQLLYIINITIGTPPQNFAMQIDTGSSDIWVPSSQSDLCQQERQACQLLGEFDSSRSSSFEDVGRGQFSISYVDGTQIQGDYMTDTLHIGQTEVTNMTMGLAQQASSAPGVMGIGYAADESIAAQDPDSIYPNVINQLKNQGHINTLAYSLWLNDLESLTGSILFGGVDKAKYRGDLIGLPVQKDTQSGNFTSFTVAMTSLVLNTPKGPQRLANNVALPVILDSGTTDTYLPDDLATTILNGVGAIQSQRSGGSYVPCDLASRNASFSFGFGGDDGPVVTVDIGNFITPLEGQSGRPLQFNDGTAACAFGLHAAGQDPLLLGDSFLRSAYVVYDLENNQIGLAETIFNTTDTDVTEFSGTDIPGVTRVASSVTVSQTFSGRPGITAASQSGGSIPTNVGSATFDLGAPTGSSSSNHRGAAANVKVPAIDSLSMVVGLITLLSLVGGGSLFFFL